MFVIKTSTVFVLELEMSLGGSVVKGGEDAFLIDDAHAFGTHFEGNPHALFGNVELFGMEVGGEGAFGVNAGVGNVITTDHSFTSNFANL